MFLSVYRGGKLREIKLLAPHHRSHWLPCSETLLGSMPVIAVGLSTQHAVNREWLSASVLFRHWVQGTVRQGCSVSQKDEHMMET